MIEFFINMIPPTTTHQQKRISVRGGKPVVYESADLVDARNKLTAFLHGHAPAVPCRGAVRLVVRWCFPVTGRHRSGQYKATRPDTDNLQKLLKDVMTSVGYWRDDALVVSEVVEKYWHDTPGIYVRVEEIADAGL